MTINDKLFTGHTVIKPAPIPPRSSWWAVQSREQFQQNFAKEKERILNAGTPVQVKEGPQ